MSKINFGILDQVPAKKEESPQVRRSGYETRDVSHSIARSKPRPEERRDKQISIKGPEHVIERFQAICERDRWAYWQMLEKMTEAWERGSAD